MIFMPGLRKPASSAGGGNDAYVIALLNMTGANASTSFPDISAPARTWTPTGNAQVSTSSPPSGFTGSLSMAANGDRLEAADSTDFDMGAGDFTIECKVKRGTSGTIENIFGQGNSGLSAGYMFMRYTAANKLYAGFESETKVVTGATSVTDTNWHDVACQREGNTFKIALDGVWDGTLDLTGVTLTNIAGKFVIGQIGEYNPGQTPIRYFTGFRWSKGIARFPGFSNYTPPAGPYT